MLGDGEDGATIGVIAAAVEQVAGRENTAVQLDAIVFHARPFDPWPLGRNVLLGALAVVALLALLRRLRPWEWRVTRVAR